MPDTFREAVEGLRDWSAAQIKGCKDEHGNFASSYDEGLHDAHDALSARLTAILNARPDQEGVRRVRADGIPQSIRDCCSECQEVAWESCFIRGQCRRYLDQDIDPPFGQPGSFESRPSDQEVERCGGSGRLPTVGDNDWATKPCPDCPDCQVERCPTCRKCGGTRDRPHLVNPYEYSAIPIKGQPRLCLDSFHQPPAETVGPLGHDEPTPDDYPLAQPPEPTPTDKDCETCDGLRYVPRMTAPDDDPGSVKNVPCPDCRPAPPTSTGGECQTKGCLLYEGHSGECLPEPDKINK